MVENEEFYDEDMLVGTDLQDKVNVLTKEEFREMFDTQARRRANMSGEEFIRAWDAGEFDDDPERVIFLAMLVDIARESWK